MLRGLLVLLVPATAFAGGLDLYSNFAAIVHLESYKPLIASAAAVLLVATMGVFFRRRLAQQADCAPSGKVDIVFCCEQALAFLKGIADDQFGKKANKYLPLLAGLFLYILVSNLSGLVPGFPPATENFSCNLALGLVAFLVYNAAGIREHGVSYAKQFAGPMLVLAPLFVCLELISHAARPLSLAFRLTANIFGDHLLLGVFAHMAPIGVPAALLFFGLLVACIQSFVFTMLTAIYISLAVSHDH